MKRIFTLLVLSTAMLSTAFAQYGQRGQRDNDKSDDVYVFNDNRGYDKHDNDNDRGYGKYDNGRGYGKHDNDFGRGNGRGSYMFTARDRDMEIAQINREYGFKIQSVKNRYGMSWYQKKRMINDLDAQREAELSFVMRKFSSPKNKFGDYGRNKKRCD